VSKRGKPLQPDFRESPLSAEAFALFEMPGFLLRLNHQRSHEIFTAHVGTGLTRQQFCTLVVLSQNDGITQRRLAEAGGFDKSTLHEMLTRLIGRGLVERGRSEADRRALTLRITGPGRALLAATIPRVLAAQEAMLAPLPEKHRAIFLDCLRLLLARSG
jgi:DNA-binding MarR family transcriptional regulator